MRISWLRGETRGGDRALTVGNFDGVHLGHQALLERLRTEAAARSLVPTVLTFDPHPLRVLAPERTPEPLTTLDRRIDLLAAHGVAGVAAIRFDRDVAALSPEAFVHEVAVERLQVRLVVASAGFRFGAGGRGDVATLRRVGAETGLETVDVPPLLVDGRPVSSTRVREALKAGEVDLAARLLGRPHWIDGAVERGVGRGRKIGFPTANLGPIAVLAPAEGIYAAWARWDDEVRPAAVHVGRRLTFEGDFTIEAHLLDTDADLYGKRLALGFVRRVRGDRKFPGPEELAAQIGRDVAAVRGMLAGGPTPVAGGAGEADAQGRRRGPARRRKAPLPTARPSTFDSPRGDR
jgi:riboflavin kinase/FMN adenylyltransferase